MLVSDWKGRVKSVSGISGGLIEAGLEVPQFIIASSTASKMYSNDFSLFFNKKINFFDLFAV